VDRHLHFQLAALVLILSTRYRKENFCNKLFSNAVSFRLKSCLSHIVSTVSWVKYKCSGRSSDMLPNVKGV
jgi:hypothetical protein